MRSILVRAACLLLLTLPVVAIYSAPTIGTTTASPNAISVGTLTTVTVTSSITDPTVIPTGVNLLRLNSNGTSTIIGQLRDDGTNGDALARDKIFSTRVTFNESQSGQIRLQVSAAFKGLLKRVLSSIVAIEIADAAALIGPAGGQIEVTNPQSSLFGSKLVIPAGALGSTFAVSITTPLSLPPVPTGYTSSLAIELQPSGLPLRAPVLLTVPATVPSGTFFYLYNEYSQSWEHVDSGLISNNTQFLVKVPHFSTLSALCGTILSYGLATCAAFQPGSTVTYHIDTADSLAVGVTQADAAAAIRRAINKWQAALSGRLSLVEASLPCSVDVTFRWSNSNIIFSVAPTTLAFNSIDLSGSRVVTFNATGQYIWSSDAISGCNLVRIEAVALHEFGHTLGLGHSCYRDWLPLLDECQECLDGPVMAPRYNCGTSCLALQQQDIDRIRQLYPVVDAIGFGAWASNGPWTPAHLDDFISLVERPVSVFMWFQNWDSPFSPENASEVARRKAVPMITWEPTGSKGSAAYALKNIGDGLFDDYIRKWAQSARAWGGTIYLRLMHEMNGDWYPWGTKAGNQNRNDSKSFVEAWKRIHGIFLAEGAVNVKFVWNPNVQIPGGPSYYSLYPRRDEYGEYVDLIALDGYNWGDNSTEGTSWQTFEEIFRDSYSEITLLTSKPLIIAETASAEDPVNPSRKASWITDAFLRAIPSMPGIRGVIWFNENKKNTGKYERDWRVDTSPASLCAFRRAVNAARYQGAFPLNASWTPNFVQNGDFSQKLQNWTTSIYPGCAGQRTASLLSADSPYSDVLEVKSVGAGGCGGDSGVYQPLNVNVADYSSLVLSANVKAISSTVGSGCGWLGGEHPIEINLLYQNTSGQTKYLQFGFYYDGGTCPNPPPDPDWTHVPQQVTQGQWFSFVSGDIKSIIPTASVITGIWVRGNGWDYVGRADNISLLGQSNVGGVVEDFNLGVIPAGWIDISTSSSHPAIVQDGSRGVLSLFAQGGNVYDFDCGLERRNLNGQAASSWVLDFVARDLTGTQSGGWSVGVGQGSYLAPGNAVVQFSVHHGNMAPAYFGYHLNRIGTGFAPNFSTNFPRDSAYHTFQIRSDGRDIFLSIDGMLVGTIANEAFQANRVFMGIDAPPAQVLIDSISFRPGPT